MSWRTHKAPTSARGSRGRRPQRPKPRFFREKFDPDEPRFVWGTRPCDPLNAEVEYEFDVWFGHYTGKSRSMFHDQAIADAELEPEDVGVVAA